MRLVEIRMLEGPNVYRLEPAVKIEVVVGRRRSWYGQRTPGRHSIVRLGAPVPLSTAPPPVRELVAWVRRLHTETGADAWIALENAVAAGPARPGAIAAGAARRGAEDGTLLTSERSERSRGARRFRRARVPVAVHRSSEPGHWIVVYPWRELERAETIARGALRLVEIGAPPSISAGTPKDARGASSDAGGAQLAGTRTLGRIVRAIRAAGDTPPPWIRDADRRIPCVSISGTNGKSTTTRMITHILLASGRHVGTTTSDGVLFDEQLVEAGDLTGPAGARSVFDNPQVEVAVLETARGGIVLKGIGYESNDVSVLTNVSPDHLDLQGIHTLPELAEVKQTIARITRADGVVVLNADDPLVAATARRVRAAACLFTLDPRSRRLRRHVARGGQAITLDDGRLIEVRGSERRPIVPVAEVPATLAGLARHNVANAMAACGAALALGSTIEEVAAGLRSFAPTADQAPGRLNCYRVGNRVVIVDFAHNEAGVDAVLDVAEGLVGRRAARPGRAFVSMIVGTAGDRPDDALRAIGRVAAQRADEVSIKETLRYLRGRTRELLVGELLAGMALSGVRRGDVPIYEDEPSATRGELTDSRRLAGGPLPGVLVVMCHADRTGVVEAITQLGGEPVAPGALRDVIAGR